jgi:hypothetical protein
MSGGRLNTYITHKASALFKSSSEGRRKHTASLEQLARETINQTYLEDDPSVAEWFRDLVPSSAGVAEYVSELFPSAQWMRRYNLHWLMGDMIAGTVFTDNTAPLHGSIPIGITVGLVVVPQAMAYALLARLTPAFGLYTTFTGACIYWIFGTSKDIVIGVRMRSSFSPILYSRHARHALTSSRLPLLGRFWSVASSARSKLSIQEYTSQKTSRMSFLSLQGPFYSYLVSCDLGG